MAKPDQSGDRDIFDAEALAKRRLNLVTQGEVLRVSPGWISWVYHFLVWLFVVGIVFLCVVQTHNYAEGTGVVRVDSRLNLASPKKGVVEFVAIESGQEIEAGQLLFGIKATVDEAGAGPPETSPAGSQPKSAVVEAPVSGTVLAVLVKPEEHVLKERVLAVVIPKDAQLSIAAVFPSAFQAEIKKGRAATFSILDSPGTFREVTIVEVLEAPVAADPALEYLGLKGHKARLVSQSNVLARAGLPSPHHEEDTRGVELLDGMQGTLRVELPAVPIVVEIFPGLRNLWERLTRDDSH